MTSFLDSVSVGPSGVAALGKAQERFEQWGFEVLERDELRVVLRGPGMHSNREARARGASKVTLAVLGEQLVLDAQMGAADRMERFCRVFPVGLCLLLGVVLGTIFWFVFPPKIAFVAPLFCLLTAVPWLAIGPAMGQTVQREAREGLRSVLAQAREEVAPE